MTRSPLTDVPRWPDDVAAEYRALGYWTDETFAEFLSTRATEHTARIAAVGPRAADPKGRVRLSYEALDAEVARVGTLLCEQGVSRGDRVIVQLPNTIEFLTSVFAIFRIGALPVFALPAHRERELTQFCRIADPAAHLVAGTRWGHDHLALAGRVGDDLRSTGHEPPLVIDVETWNTADRAPSEIVGVPAEDVAFLQLSGGTTGVSKLIPRTHADYLYSVRESATICGVDANTVMLVALPAAHNFAMSSPGILGVLHRGGTVVLAGDPSPRTAFELIESECVTMASLVPPLLHAWLSLAARRRFDISTLNVVQVGGARLADSAAARVGDELGARLQQVFGMAEGLVNYTRLDDPDDLVRTTQGRPISPADEILVVDDQDRPVALGEEGHLLTRGPYTIRGYYRGGEQDLAAFTPDGYYRTGDLVRRLPTGHLVVTGRAKDQINRGGDKIAVDELENILLTHPDVHDAAVVAIPDDYLGEHICAFIVPEGDALDAEALKAHLRGAGLATFKIPDRIETVPSFPATGVGKTSRPDLRRRLASGLAGHGPAH